MWMRALLIGLSGVLTLMVVPVHAACTGYPAGVAAGDQVFRYGPPAAPYVNPISSSSLASPEAGATVYSSSGGVQYCNGSSWISLGSGGGGGAAPTDRISTTNVDSGALLGMVVAQQGTVSFTLGGTAGAAYLHPTLGFVGPGVSASGAISTTGSGYFAGNVGIGTSAPTSKLKVVANTGAIFAATGSSDKGIYLTDNASYAEIIGLNSAGNGYNSLMFRVSSLAYPYLFFPSSGAGIGIATQSPTATLQVSGTFTVSNSAQTTTPSLYVDSSGNVGIGTTAPTYSVDINNGSLAIRGDSGQHGEGLLFRYTPALEAYIMSVATGVGGRPLNIQGYPIKFKSAASGVELARIDTNGNVGIGTTTPSGTLSISGTVAMSLYSAAPVACGATYKGLMALTSAAHMCVCDSSSWVDVDGRAACSW